MDSAAHSPILPYPSALTSSDDAGDACVVWPVDLTTTSRVRTARALLRQATEQAMSTTRRRGRLRHLVIIYRCMPRLRVRLRGVATALARHLHAEIELSRARYLDVVVLDATGADGNLLDRRIHELANQSAGIVGYAAIPWEDLATESIRSVCTRGVI